MVVITVIFGVLSSTIFGLYLAPLFFMTVNSLFGRFRFTKRKDGALC